VPVALVIQYAERMRRILLSYVACPALPYFPTLSHKQHEFKEIMNTECVLIFPRVLSLTFCKELSEIWFKKCVFVSMWSTRYCCHTWGQIKLKLSQQIFEKQSKIKFQENPSYGSRVFLCGTDDGWADNTRTTVAFHSFAKASNNKSLWLQDTFLTMHGYVFVSRHWPDARC
jgi:hypothetical protein